MCWGDIISLVNKDMGSSVNHCLQLKYFPIYSISQPMLQTDVRAVCFGNLVDTNIKQICAAIHPPQGI